MYRRSAGSTNKPMTRTTKKIIAAAAIAGLLTGTMAQKSSADDTKPGKEAKDSKVGKHDCKGKNDCKGQGGCKSGDNGCKGKNTCKGKGGCATNKDKK